MKFYRCDMCEIEEQGEPPVVLTGVTGLSGGILLPERFHEKHFCSPGCFWEWVEKYNPKKVVQVGERI